MSLETIRFELLGLQGGERVLDLGCGEGRHAISAYLQYDVHVIGLDLSAQDLETARQRLRQFQGGQPPADKSCNFLRASGLALPFQDDAFDVIICSEVLEHIQPYEDMLNEIARVLKPGGIFATSVPRFFPEWVCWQLSDAYHEVEGGHVRIFTTGQLHRAIGARAMRRFKRHWAHSLHVPYWWLRCLFWRNADDNPLVATYHRLLVWDLMRRPWITRLLDKLLNPIMGKSVVMYYENRA